MAKWNSAPDFMAKTLGLTIDMDKAYGGQCWDYGDYFWVNQIGRVLQTGGKDARGCWTVASARKTNAGSEFELITDKNKLQPGDWVVLNVGKYGHIGMVKSIVKTGVTIALQAQHNAPALLQKVTVSNYSLSTFLGAFRYKKWATSGANTFLPAKGYWKYGDIDSRIGLLNKFYAEQFYGYFYRTHAAAWFVLRGNKFGSNCLKWTREFQKRTGLVVDGVVGAKTYAKLRQYGFGGWQYAEGLDLSDNTIVGKAYSANGTGQLIIK